MTVIQFMLVVAWAVFVLSSVITAGVSAGLQGARLGNADPVPFFWVFLIVSVASALFGAPLFVWIL